MFLPDHFDTEAGDVSYMANFIDALYDYVRLFDCKRLIKGSN